MTSDSLQSEQLNYINTLKIDKNSWIITIIITINIYIKSTFAAMILTVNISRADGDNVML